MRLALIHQLPGSAPAPAEATTWRTCLREIHFLPESEADSDGALADADAYALLLEVVCGLRSPIIGETEVQAQFKQFLATDAQADPGLVRLGQRVLGDAKHIRHKFLQGFGAHSYGRLAAGYLTGERLAVIGTGALAAQVIHAAPAEMRVDVWGRSSERVLPTRPEGLTFSLLADARPDLGRPGATSLVVAAPVGSDDLDKVTSVYRDLRAVVDVRSLDQQTPIHSEDGELTIVTLADILGRASQSEQGGAPRVRAARTEVRSLATQFASYEQLRPLGWDDVCA